LPYSTSTSQSTAPLDLVYSDVWGSAINSFGNKKYYISFIDDYSKFMWIYPIHRKFEAFQFFKEFQTLVELMLNRKIITMQTDWGGEYERLNSFSHSVGITHHVSCPYAHQQNGVTEQKHRHIVEMELSLLATASMPLKFWDQAFLVATHLINHTPTNILDYDTPLHRLLGATPDYTNLCVFGCACWPNLRPYNSHKLQYRSKRCVFLGYSNLHKGYKCLHISTGRIYISHDVIFYEGIFSFAALHPTVGARYTANVLIPRANSDLPVINSPPAANTNELNMWTHQLLQPQTIPPSCVDDGH
jgi:hypothetical protein